MFFSLNRLCLPTRSLLLLLLGIALPLTGSAAVTVVSYSYSIAPNASYADTGATELTDGYTATNLTFWPSVTPDITPLVGWLNTTSTITFNFAPGTSITSATLWLVDSDGGAGVYLPDTFTLSDPHSSFTKTFAVTNPDGNGQVVSFNLSDFAVTTSALDLTWATTGVTWTMLTEAQFSAVPEPATYAAIVGVVGLGLAVSRRHRSRGKASGGR